ncbi:MAG: alpha/beta hydrolase [Alphaproteobacteria bacterium]|nr:alpha/beta hydrolase [Alphaproteobacteria bacterium]
MRLAHDVVGSDAPEAPEVWILHGILGSKRNWRGFARQLAQARPDLRLVLPDLRCHGDSGSGTPPHTLAACVDDLEALAATRPTAPAALVGHSFGGKVVLAWHARHPALPVWVLDAVPGAVDLEAPGVRDDPEDVLKVLDAIGRVPLPVPDFESLRTQLAAEGLSPMLAAWMTTNLVRGEGGLVWRLDLGGVRALLADYACTDLWPAVDAGPGEVHLVRALRSSRWTPEVLARADAATARPGVHLHGLQAGHWVHTDAPDALQKLLAGGLPRQA